MKEIADKTLINLEDLVVNSFGIAFVLKCWAPLYFYKLSDIVYKREVFNSNSK